MDITKIVITGGPCAGKTTALRRIQDTFSKSGYTVLLVSETATELITGGVAPWTCGTNAEYQTLQLQLQLKKESIFEKAAQTMAADKVLIVCDRGALDNKAYMTAEEFTAAAQTVGSSEVVLRDSYDAVFHLVTAAKGATAFYTTANNAARTETLEQASTLDDRLICAWTGHPHFRVIDNSTSFENKMNRLVTEIASFLGEPEPCELERKFLIEYPDIEWLEGEPLCQRTEIIQTYLNSRSGEEIRVRQRGTDGQYVYFQTIKKKISALKRIELEKRLSQDEYLILLMDADTTRHPIRKTRYCLTYENQYFEIDIYPFWDDKAIVEIELTKEDQPIVFPEKLRVIREVTNEDAFKNASLARS